MYVRRKRFVRRKHSSEGNTNWSLALHVASATSWRLRGVAIVIATLVISLPLVLFFVPSFSKLALKVDPRVYESIASSEPITVYVVSNSPSILEISHSEKWHFGDFLVLKTVIHNSAQLHFLLSRRDIISIYAEKSFKHAPLYWLDVSEYNFRERDIDNELHKATGPWIGRDVTVAIIDTGIDYTHPDFYDENNRSIIKVLINMFYVSATTGKHLFWEPYKNGTMEDLLDYDMWLWQEYGEPAFLDINGHGTHVAGIVAGRGWASNGTYRGIAPGVKLVIVKAFDKDGMASMDMCLEALEWVYNNTERYDIKILSLSWGAVFASDGNDPLSLAVDELVEEKGVWVFAAAGNEGNFPTTIVVPAVARKAIAVGAWDAYYDKVAPFSSLGPTVDMRMKPDVMGAGVMVVSCKSRYVDFPDEYEVGEYYVALSGTSMATPAVAGVAACFIEYYHFFNDWNPSRSDFIRWLEINSRRIGLTKDFLTGWGIPIAPHT